MMSIPELFEAAEAAMIIAETSDMSDVRRLTSALRAQTLMLQAQVIQNAAGGKESFLKSLKDKFSSTYRSEDTIGLRRIVEAPFGALVILDWARTRYLDARDAKGGYQTTNRLISPRDALIIVMPYQKAGWDVRVVRSKADEGFEVCKSHDGYTNTTHIDGQTFCEVCCQLVVPPSGPEESGG
jgi:hypothetical protein